MNAHPRVLVVEDDKSWQEIYRDVLTDLGYVALIVATKSEALLEVEKNNFDAFVIDIKLDHNDVRNKDGLSILKRLCERSEADRAILNSADMTTAFREEIDQLGAFAVLEKNDKYRLPHLIDSLQRAVAHGGRM